MALAFLGEKMGGVGWLVGWLVGLVCRVFPKGCHGM